MYDWQFEQVNCWCGHRKRKHDLDMCLICYMDNPEDGRFMHSWHPDKKFNVVFGFTKGEDQYTDYLKAHPT